MSNLIVRAEREVFLATNYWEDSVASKFLTDALRELDRRAGQRGVKVVVKIMYDRGNPKQVLEPHYIVSEKEFTGKNVKIPPTSEIPNLDLQVMNYHQPMLGTFHAKYMVVDRKIAVLQSDNIQDNDNLEMMIHLEGPIVDSFYDMALISWHKKLEPPLPSLNSPAAQGGIGGFGPGFEGLFGPGGVLKGSSVVIDPAQLSFTQAYGQSQPPPNRGANPESAAPAGTGSVVPPQGSENPMQPGAGTGPSTTESIIHPHPAKDAVGGAQTESTGDEGTHQYRSSETNSGAVDKQAEEFLGRGEQALPQAQIIEPTSGQVNLPEHSSDEPHYDDDIASEVARVQSEVSSRPGETRMQAVTRLLNHTTNKGFTGDAPECPPHEEMTPYIPHPAHEPFPMALVNRNPYGPPNHKSVSNPQNAAWLSALRNAKKNVFIQSPTLNAEPLVPAIREACERGIDVYCYICLGYNDTVCISQRLLQPFLPLSLPPPSASREPSTNEDI